MRPRSQRAHPGPRSSIRRPGPPLLTSRGLPAKLFAVKLSHAAAWASVVGWYLMLPPLADYRINGQHIASMRDTSAPFSKWTTLSSFDTAAECEKALVVNSEAALNRGEGDQPYQCVATDDPRLKEK